MSATILRPGEYSRSDAKPYGYLALFPDGDIKRHATIYRKTHCVRVKLHPIQRWQSAPLMLNSPVVDGMQLHSFPYGHLIYEWFSDEASAASVAKRALAQTHDEMLHEGFCGSGKVHPLNQEFLGTPRYSEVHVVPATVVWDHGVNSLCELVKAVDDPRLVVSPALTPREAVALALETRARLESMEAEQREAKRT